jgi:FAD/FMN-containing dehydrogenase/Fe-S oxidoreductase
MNLHTDTPRTTAIPARIDPRFHGGMSATARIDVRGLEHRLKATVDGEVRFDPGARALYASDASNFRQPPIGVVIPRTIDGIVAAHAACREFGAPITSRGAGTSLSGETINFAVIIDHSKYLHHILQIDSSERWVHAETGVINQVLNEATGRYGLIFPPDPSTHAYCTIGGNIGNNSCGVHSVQGQCYGHGPRTSDNVHSLEILTYDGERMWVGATSDGERERIVRAGGRRGEIYRRLHALAEQYAPLIRDKYPPVEKLPRRVSGYNLDELLPEKGFNVARALVGTEGTCVTVLTAKLWLTPNVRHRTLVVIGFEDICIAADHVPEIMVHKPIALEALDRTLVHNERLLQLHVDALSQLPAGHAWLMVELGGDTRAESDDRADALIADLKSHREAPTGYSIMDDEQQAKRLWSIREAGLSATAFPPQGGDHWPGWEDSAVPPESVGAYLRDLRALFQKYGYDGALYGHFGQGCVHSRISFDLRTAPGIRAYRAFLEEAADLVVSYGGSISGEHGDGQQRAELLVKQFGEELIDAMREFKRVWDPDWKMNPGKVVDPYRLDEYLRLGADYDPPRPVVKFAYPEDGGDFAHATVRCVGVGRCRIPSARQTMCPSFQVTREEQHTTRGRARLLFEMLEGDVITDGWRSRPILDALDLCLACKGCTNDCPVHVDMPTYKAEFLSHYYAGRLRPRHAYAFGFVDQAARLASRAPAIANWLAHTEPFAAAGKWIAGMSPRRSIPRFAPMTLQQWFTGRAHAERPIGPPVVLWPDTFNNYFHPEVGIAAVETLEAAGWRVLMPRQHVCCGRPLYDYGFVDAAERYLRRTLRQLRGAIRAGTPVVGLEPSCVATFKHELGRMLPHDDDAKRLGGQIYHFSEFVAGRALAVPRLDRAALLWGHCHHKATGGTGAERQVLERMGMAVREVTGGCCGLAGSWGFEAGHHDISMQCGEQALLPAVRETPRETLIIADGFSCKTQIADGTGRRALHVAEVIYLARTRGRADITSGTQHAAQPTRPRRAGAQRRRRIAAVGTVALAVAAAAYALNRTRRWA